MVKIARRGPGGEVIWRSEEVDAAIDALAPDFRVLHEASYVERDGQRIPPLVMTVEKGGVRFADDLVATTKRQYPDFDPDRDSVRWSTYWKPVEGGAEPIPTLKKGIAKARVYGRIILNLDDILETGKTSQANEEYLRLLGAVMVLNIYMIKRTNPEKPQLAKAALAALETDRRAWVIGRDLDDKKLIDDPYWGKIYPDGGRSLDDIIVSPNSPHAY